MGSPKKQYNLTNDEWANPNIHLGYLHDTIRNDAYRAAIKKYVKPGSTVVDVGCGSGILSFFAAQAGSKKIYSIESSDCCAHAKAAAALNGFSDRIHFLNQDLFKAKLKEGIDVIIHEQIGSFLWDEGMQQKIGYVRDRFLKKDGIILPGYFELSLVPVSLTQTVFNQYPWRKKYYGLSFRNFEKVSKEFFERNLLPKPLMLRNESSFLTKPEVVATCDLYRPELTPPRKIQTKFEIQNTVGVCTGIVGFFEVFFDEKISFQFSTRLMRIAM